MSYDVDETCGKQWTDNYGKKHECAAKLELREMYFHICECSCGAQFVKSQTRMRPNKRPPLKLAHWKRGKKVKESETDGK